MIHEERERRGHGEPRRRPPLAHPNIVTLHDRLARGPLAVAEAIATVREVARGVAYAHANRVIHRDLKPSNVFLTDDGRVKVLDSGLAYMFGGRVPMRGGTRPYMTPEERRGGAADERGDVFALGVILQEALTGRRPDGRRPRGVPGPGALGELLARMLASDSSPPRGSRPSPRRSAWPCSSRGTTPAAARARRDLALLRADPLLARVRDEPRYAALARKMGLPLERR